MLYRRAVYTYHTARNALRVLEYWATFIVALPFHVPLTLWMHRHVTPLLAALPPTWAHSANRAAFLLVLLGPPAVLIRPGLGQWLFFSLEPEEDGLRYSLPRGLRVERGLTPWNEITLVSRGSGSCEVRLGSLPVKFSSLLSEYGTLVAVIQRCAPPDPPRPASAWLAGVIAPDAPVLEAVHEAIRAGRKSRAIALLQNGAGLDLKAALNYAYTWADEQEAEATGVAGGGHGQTPVCPSGRP